MMNSASDWQWACCPSVTIPTNVCVSANFMPLARLSPLSVLMPGYYAAAMDRSVVTSTKICPQGYWCPGGVANSSFTPAPWRLWSFGWKRTYEDPYQRRRLLWAEAVSDTIILCATGWTVEPGATSIEQCRECRRLQRLQHPAFAVVLSCKHSVRCFLLRLELEGLRWLWQRCSVRFCRSASFCWGLRWVTCLSCGARR